jgi:hypothetical protein
MEKTEMNRKTERALVDAGQMALKDYVEKWRPWEIDYKRLEVECEAWAQALESGKYTKGGGGLYDSHACTHCALGVWCESQKLERLDNLGGFKHSNGLLVCKAIENWENMLPERYDFLIGAFIDFNDYTEGLGFSEIVEKVRKLPALVRKLEDVAEVKGSPRGIVWEISDKKQLIEDWETT